MDNAIPPQSPAIGGGGAVFDRASALRTESAVRWIETYYRNRKPDDGVGPSVGPVWLWKAKTGTGGIPAASANDTPSTGALVTLGVKNKATGKYETNGIQVPVDNPGGAIAGSRWITIGWVGGLWEPVVDPCP